MIDTRLQGDVAVVTGAGRNIGRAIAERFGEEGGRVVVVDIDSESAAETAETIADNGGEAIAVTADIADEDDVERIVTEAESAFGPIDVLVNNAAIKEESPFLEMPTDMFDRTIAVNLRGMFLCTRECAKSMRQSDSGVVINLSSTSGHKAEPTSVAYGTTKGAVINFTRSTAEALAEHGIRVNTLTPTRTGKRTLPDEQFETKGLSEDDLSDADIVEKIPLGRLGDPRDIANAAVFLVSDEGEFVNGTELRVNGGRSA
ncbi:SDR family NAD(P)-dependent oxidoreductase [Salinigranum halophilum]|jgi:NAD(P)-dependent dehydrogenase (short-subunit alcohol dehydrogenase family)|uniref:SDR family NAD(P)-dependent oxidoreductase n=1 Tax=Salinigranum halophilum TaxID=2565931 RepID=UPI001375EADD|nr:3-oxoacyl-ACP reductase family protein [Salinigranum halophilum]